MVYRAASSDAPFWANQGDSPQFCFQMPVNTTMFSATFRWDTPNQMVLAFGAPGYEDDTSKVHSDPPERPPREFLGPLEVRVENPEPGTWAANGVPWAVGAGANWEMALRWELTGQGTADALGLDDGACFEEADVAATASLSLLLG